jgi:hypothetical protein
MFAVGWLDRMDERNQRRAERDNARFQAESDGEDVSNTEAVASYAAFAPT